MPPKLDKSGPISPVVKSPVHPARNSPTHSSPPISPKAQSFKRDLDEFEILEDTQDSKVVKYDHDFEIIEHTDVPDVPHLPAVTSRSGKIAQGAIATFHTIRKSNTLWYSSHLIGAILMNDYLGAITAIGHLSVIVAQQCGYNLPQITHSIIKYSSYAYKYKIVNKMILVGQYLRGPKYVSATSIFASNLDLMLYRLGQEIFAQRLQKAQVAYDMINAFADRKSFLRWFLITLREELIRLGIYSAD